MFRLALGLENSVTLNTLKLHLKQLCFPDSALESIASHLESINVSYFDTIVSFTLTSESTINIVLGTPLGQINVYIILLNSLWRVSVGVLDQVPYSSVTVAVVDSNDYIGIYDNQPLSQLILTGVDVMKAGTQAQLLIATDPPFYKEDKPYTEPPESTETDNTDTEANAT